VWLLTATGARAVARRVSVLGVDLPPSVLATWGLTPAASGYSQSRACSTADSYRYRVGAVT
jgi:hypothetical protein